MSGGTLAALKYQFEYAPKQAWWWARKFKKFDEPAVVGAMIRLGNCFDLLDPENVEILKGLHAKLKDELQSRANFRQHRRVDCAVFNYFYNG
jgi:hypothetical protein